MICQQTLIVQGAMVVVPNATCSLMVIVTQDDEPLIEYSDADPGL